MNENLITRLTLPAAVAAAAVGIPADLYHLTIDSRAAEAHTLLFKAHGWMLVIAMGLLVVVLAGLVLRLAGRDGRLPAVTAAVTTATFAGTLLVLGNISTEAFAMPQAGTAVDEPAGYWLTIVVLSFVWFGFGWAATGVLAARAGLLSRGLAAYLVLAGLVAFSPLAGSYVLLLVGVAILGRQVAARDVSTTPDLQRV
jgi:hypothetical protein